MTNETKNLAQEAFNRGQDYFKKEDYDNALKELSEVINLD